MKYRGRELSVLNNSQPLFSREKPLCPKSKRIWIGRFITLVSGKVGVPVPVIAANTDTSMKYIQEHYFHYRADESTEILGKGRKIKPADESLRWIGSG